MGAQQRPGGKSSSDREIWLMVPAGALVDQTIGELSPLLESGDTIIDGNSTTWISNAPKRLRSSGIHYVDVGTSGGIWGLERGYCMMIGGEPEIVQRPIPSFCAWRREWCDVADALARPMGGTAEQGYPE